MSDGKVITIINNLASAVLTSQELYDSSWHGDRHMITHEQATEMACKVHNLDEEFAFILSLLNKVAWNDIQMWAKDVVAAREQIESISEECQTKGDC